MSDIFYCIFLGIFVVLALLILIYCFMFDIFLFKSLEEDSMLKVITKDCLGKTRVIYCDKFKMRKNKLYLYKFLGDIKHKEIIVYNLENLVSYEILKSEW